MLNKWLTRDESSASNYKFAVTYVRELCKPDHDILHHLARELLLAHGSPRMIRDEYVILLKDAEEVGLDILKDYVEREVLPARDRIETRIGNFGEILAARFLVEFEHFWFPIYKLRFREKKDWAIRLTDVCVVRVDDVPRPLVCYGEVKTKSAGCNLELATEGHDSLAKDDALTDPEILRFICTLLYETGRQEEGQFLSGIRLGALQYDRRHDLFLVHHLLGWNEEVLDRLEARELDERLVDFSVRVFLVAELRAVIDAAYALAWEGAREIVSG